MPGHRMSGNTARSGCGDAVMRGREREWALVADLFSRCAVGRPRVLLVEGEPGSGRSLLLRNAARGAAARGLLFAVCGIGDPARPHPVGSLLDAFDVTIATDGPASPAAHRSARVPDRTLGFPGTLADTPRSRGAGEPVVLIFDDVQCADQATLTALHTLTARFARRPVACVLARCGVGRNDAAAHLFDLLERDGARRCVLGPLHDGAVAEIVADRLTARPHPDLADLVAGAGGNPRFLTALLTGLRDEDMIRVRNGQARLVADRLPKPLRAAVRARLDDLSPGARHLLSVAAVLGRSFSPDDVAELMGRTPARLWPSVDEVLSTGLVGDDADGLSFRHGLVPRVLTESMPAAVREGLHRQIGELMARRHRPEEAAFHLIQGARAGDMRALADLDRAVAELMPSAPRTSAELAEHALGLTTPEDPARDARVLTAVRALTSAGRLDDADELTRTALERPMPALACARLHCLRSEILHLGGHAAEAAAAASIALAEPHVPESLRDDAELLWLAARAATGADVRERARAVVASASEHGAALVCGALVALAVAEWDAGRLAAGLRLARDAVRRTPPAEAWRIHPRVILATLLTDARRFDEARTVLATAGDDVDRHTAWAPAPAVLRARMHLMSGRLRDALTEGEAALAAAEESCAHAFTASALAALAAAALRIGDVDAAREYAARGLRCPYGAPFAHPRLALIAAQVAEARDGPEAVAGTLDALCAGLRRHASAPAGDPAAAAWLVRTALALGDRPHAEAAVAAAEALVGDPELAATGIAAAHARALLERSPEALKKVAETHSDPWARASAWEDLGLLTDVRADTVAHLDAALRGYAAIGAARDTARVRRRLRRLGVRRRHWHQADRPVSGWASLTDTEWGVSELVAQGLTNRQVADRLFMSVHTVAFHLRHVFRKLDVSSRVELTRLVMRRSA